MPLVTAVFCRTQRNPHLEERYLRYIDASVFYLPVRIISQKDFSFFHQRFLLSLYHLYIGCILIVDTVDRTILGFGFIRSNLQFYLIISRSKLGRNRKENRDFGLAETIYFGQLVHTCTQHNLLVLIQQFHSQVTVARHTIEVLDSEEGKYLAALFSLAVKSWLPHQLEAGIFRTDFRDASGTVFQFHPDNRCLLHRQEIIP